MCKVCDKAFAYAHSLTKHELIHSDIKLYRCDYCNKDFRLLHHMRQHEETKLHQNAVMLAESMKVEMVAEQGAGTRSEFKLTDAIKFSRVYCLISRYNPL